jgi:hypothetical protein
VSKINLLSNNKSIFTLIVSTLIIIIMDSSLTIFCTTKSSRIINISNTELYLIYSIIFIISNIVLFNIVKNIKSHLSNKYYYFLILIVQSLLSIILLTIYGQTIFYSNYSNFFIFVIMYASFLSSIGFLSILTIKLLRWFSFSRNYSVLLYGIAISFFILNTIIGLVYVSQVLLAHPDTIKPALCRVLFGSLFHINPGLSIYLSNLYDITSIISFIAVWFVTIFMLKQYSRNIGKIKYWILVSIPLIVFMTKYEIILYYFLKDPAILEIFSSIRLNSIVDQIVYTFLNSNLQIGGIFFAMVFLVIAKKIPKGHKIVNSLIISSIGMMFLFGSKNVSALIIPSFPPVGIVAISFLGLASYLLLVGIYSIATIVARDITLRKYLSKKVENDTTLLNNIAYAVNENEIQKNVKSLMNYSLKWQQENNKQLEMNQQEIKEIVDSVISEVKEIKSKNDGKMRK